MAPAPLTEQGHHLCSLWSRGRKGHARRACAAPLAVGMVQVGYVLLDPYMHPKNILRNATPSSSRRVRAPHPQRRHCSVLSLRFGSSKEGGRLLGQPGRGD